MRKINSEGLKLIQQWEGCELEAYEDIVGVVTIGYGHTAAAGAPIPKLGMKITKAEAVKILKNDLSQYENAVNNAVNVELTDNQFAALVSWCFNVGIGAMRRSSLIRKLNAGNYDAVPSELMKWTRAGGRVVSGLANRRAAEAGLWSRGMFVSSNFMTATPKPLTQSKTMAGGAMASIGTAGTAVNDIAAQIEPLAYYSQYFLYGFLALTIIGLLLVFYSRITDHGG